MIYDHLIWRTRQFFCGTIEVTGAFSTRVERLHSAMHFFIRIWIRIPDWDCMPWISETFRGISPSFVLLFLPKFKAVMLLAVNVNSLQFEDKSIRHIHITFINYNKWIVMYTKRFAIVHVKLPSTPLHGKKLVWGRQPWPFKLFSLEVPVALSLDQPRATRIWYVSWTQG